MVIGSRIIHFSETDSTNAEAVRLLSTSRPVEGSVIITDFQKLGRGMDNNSWESAPGQNLTFTLILYPTFLPVDQQFRLNQAISLGIADSVKNYCNAERVTVKWPNDIYIDEKKVSGILIQHSVMGNHFEYTLAGIGLNVNQQDFRSAAPNPVSLRNITGQEFSLASCLTDICQSIDLRYSQLREGKTDILNNEYLSILYRKEEWHPYLLKGAAVEARISGISNYGQLLLETSDRILHTCDIKEVKYL